MRGRGGGGGKEVESKEGQMKEKAKRGGGRGRLYIGEREGVCKKGVDFRSEIRLSVDSSA